jgi:hypothetical protein
VPEDSKDADEVAEAGEHDEHEQGSALPPSTRGGPGRNRSGSGARKKS